MIGYVIISDKKKKPTSNITMCTGRRDNLNAALIVVTCFNFEQCIIDLTCLTCPLLLLLLFVCLYFFVLINSHLTQKLCVCGVNVNSSIADEEALVKNMSPPYARSIQSN